MEEGVLAIAGHVDARPEGIQILATIVHGSRATLNDIKQIE